MNFRLCVENDNRPPVILKGIAGESPMKDLHSMICESFQISSFEILTGYPPAVLKFESDDLLSAKFTGNSHLLVIRLEKGETQTEKSSAKKSAKSKSTKQQKQPKIAKPPTALSASGDRASYFADRI